MEESIKEQQSTPLPGNSARPKLQRYALRSGTKPKEEKLPVPELSNPPSSASKRGRSVSSVSKSVGVLDLSAKDKSAKPPRRLSIPTKNVSPTRKFVGNITPISEVRRTARSQGKSDTPASDVSRSSKKTFNLLSSTSYWLSQIKLSEAASKHSVSLGFFKLALEAGCKPLHRMRDELKSYIDRCNLDESEQTVNDLLESYNTAEDTERLQVSETISQGPEVGTRSSDDEVHSSSSSVEPRKFKPKSLNTDVTKTTLGTEVNQRNPTTTPRNRGFWNKNAAPNSTSETAKKSVKKPYKPNKQEPIQGKEKAKKQGKKQLNEKAAPASTSPEEDSVQSNKENLEAPQIEVISTEEVI
ncbi:uncharacterized protein LOC120070866 isoform X1 [Benincasa hispida]|uniref:uncharacterized protein LOC120070866 isoform X1 n=1 Tax=Benincasa hispida TaxID=102211 RepID=UPI0019006744|nr:uncharacterized protein LOC120070866 isoform X1 [Benincasa hispida]